LTEVEALREDESVERAGGKETGKVDVSGSVPLALPAFMRPLGISIACMDTSRRPSRTEAEGGLEACLRVPSRRKRPGPRRVACSREGYPRP
jgi:hypothetical protein